MLHIALFEPEIPPNTGNIIRLCANAGAQLHLIKPLGFSLTDKQLRRAGLDYREWVNLIQHESFAHFLEQASGRIFACSTKGTARYDQHQYHSGDIFLFGPETRGLPAFILEQIPAPHILRIPMLPNNRSLNLSNAAAVILYEAWRQQNFDGS